MNLLTSESLNTDRTNNSEDTEVLKTIDEYKKEIEVLTINLESHSKNK